MISILYCQKYFNICKFHQPKTGLLDLMVIGYCFSIASFMGYVFSAHHFLQIPLRLTLLFSCCVLMIVLFWASLADVLLPVSQFLMGGGVALSALLVAIKYRGSKVVKDKYPQQSLLFFVAIVVLAIVCAFFGRPSVIDDYAYWAIISKSIAMFDALPTEETTIFARHLTYTPGLALFHYYFLSAFSGYHLSVAYFAQNIFLFALLFAFTDGLNKRTTLVVMSVGTILLVLFSGSVFQKLRVDHFLSLLTAAAVWVQIKNRFSLQRFLVVLLAIGCLYLVKEVGMMLAIFLLFVIVQDILYLKEIEKKEKIISLLLCFLLSLYLIFQKYAWDTHCAALGFNQFHSGISLEAVKDAFNLIGNSDSRHGFYLFVKGILIGPADRINLPYILWYIALGWIWYTLFKVEYKDNGKKYFLLFRLAIPVFVLYLLMNYVMQFVVFGLGTVTENTTSLSRYVNIFFCWIIFLTLFSFIVSRFESNEIKKGHFSNITVVVAALLIVGSSFPTKEPQYEHEIKQLVSNMEDVFEAENQVCITPGNVTDHYLGFRMLYHFLPTKFNVTSFPSQLGGISVEQQLKTCDYLIIYLPTESTGRMLTPFTSESVEDQSMFKVVSSQLGSETISLKRIY